MAVVKGMLINQQEDDRVYDRKKVLSMVEKDAEFWWGKTKDNHLLKGYARRASIAQTDAHSFEPMPGSHFLSPTKIVDTAVKNGFTNKEGTLSIRARPPVRTGTFLDMGDECALNEYCILAPLDK